MRVWAVCFFGYSFDDDYTLGIFSSIENAEKAILSDIEKYSRLNKIRSRNDYDLAEYILDQIENN